MMKAKLGELKGRVKRMLPAGKKNLLYSFWKHESLYAKQFQAVGYWKTDISIVLQFRWMVLLRSASSKPPKHISSAWMFSLPVQLVLKITSIKEVLRIGWCLLRICANNRLPLTSRESHFLQLDGTMTFFSKGYYLSCKIWASGRTFIKFRTKSYLRLHSP